MVESNKNPSLQLISDMLSSLLPGDVAQLGERDNRTVEVRGSSPLISTNRNLTCTQKWGAGAAGSPKEV
jgi:hypothetical protein